MRNLLCVFFTFCVATTPAKSDAELILEWNVPEGCPTREHFQQRLEERIGSLDRATVWIAIAIRHEESIWHLEFETYAQGVGGKRHLTGETCDAVIGAALTILSVGMDNPAIALPETEPHVEKKKRATPLPLQPKVVRRSKTFSLFAGGSATGGELPGLAYGPSLGFALEYGPWLVPLTGSYKFAQLAEAEEAGAGANIWSMSIDLDFCRKVRMNFQFAVGICVGAGAGQLRAAGRGVENPSEKHATFGFANLKIPLEWGFGSAFARLIPTLQVPFARHEFTIGNIGVLHQPSVIFLGLSLQLGWRL